VSTAHRKRCTCCLKTKRVTQFSRAPGTKDGLHSHCRSCRSAYGRSLAGRASSLLKAAKRRAKAKGLKFSLTLDWVRGKLSAMTCEATGWMFVLAKGHHPFAPSIDRVDPRKGYTPDNCRMVLAAVNSLKATLHVDTAAAISPIRAFREVEAEQIGQFALILAVYGQELPLAA
jgi:hypothetical protein